MPAPTPPASPPTVPDTPNRLEGQDTFNTKAFAWNDWFAPYTEWLEDELVPYTDTALIWVDSQASAAASSATAAATSATAASGHANRAEDAAAAAEQAAGLTPDPDFGMVVTTTSNPDVKIATFTATVGRMQDVDTSAGTFGITTPASPAVGQWFGIRDYNQQAFYGKFPWLIYGSDKIIGLSENCTIDVNTMIFTYRGAAKGWCI